MSRYSALLTGLSHQNLRLFPDPEVLFFFQIVFDIPYLSCRDSANQTIIWNIFCHNCSCSNHNIVPNSYSRQNCYIPTDPYIISDFDRFCYSEMLPPPHRCKKIYLPCSAIATTAISIKPSKNTTVLHQETILNKKTNGAVPLVSSYLT